MVRLGIPNPEEWVRLPHGLPICSSDVLSAFQAECSILVWMFHNTSYARVAEWTKAVGCNSTDSIVRARSNRVPAPTGVVSGHGWIRQ